MWARPLQHFGRPRGAWGGGGWHKASVSECLPLAAPIGLSPLLILTLCGPERVLVVSMEPPDDLSCLTTPGVGCPGDGLSPVPLTRCIQMHTPSPRWVCCLQHCLARSGVCICRIIFLTGASNNHNESFPFPFFLSFPSFCALGGGGPDFASGRPPWQVGPCSWGHGPPQPPRTAICSLFGWHTWMFTFFHRLHRFFFVGGGGAFSRSRRHHRLTDDTK